MFLFQQGDSHRATAVTTGAQESDRPLGVGVGRWGENTESGLKDTKEGKDITLRPPAGSEFTCMELSCWVKCRTVSEAAMERMQGPERMVGTMPWKALSSFTILLLPWLLTSPLLSFHHYALLDDQFTRSLRTLLLLTSHSRQPRAYLSSWRWHLLQF